MSAPDAWAARVMEALLHVSRSSHVIDWVRREETIAAVLLKMRVGTFKEGNLNLFKRYSADVFRCHVCNYVLPRNAHAPDTTAHLSLHRKQVRAVIDREYVYDHAWDFTQEPTEEEVRRTDERLQRESDRTQARLNGFDIILKNRRTT